MAEQVEDYVKRIQEFNEWLTREIIVEECEDQMADGCMSCNAIEARDRLRKILNVLTRHSHG